MSTLFLHIGHGKTGSSWIQSSLRMSRAALAAHGIDYAHGADAVIDDPQRITSGNGAGLLSSEAAFNARLAACRPAVGRSLLFSSEYLFKELAEGAGNTFLEGVAARCGFSQVRLLLFVRNPSGHAASGWQQKIKREGSVIPIEESFAQVRMPEQVADVLDNLDKLDAVQTDVRNYSHCKDRLLDEVAAWLGVPVKTLAVPPIQRVNRSMTRAELMLQQALNRRLGPCGHLLSDPLCERLTEIAPEDVRPLRAVQEAMWDRLAPAVERVNARLPAEHHYRCDIRETPPPPDAFAFSPAQIEVIADGVADEITRLRAETKRLRATLARPETALGARHLLRAFLRRLGRVLARRLSA